MPTFGIRYVYSALPGKSYSPDEFFKLPHEARLADVRRGPQSGRAFASLIEYALGHKVSVRSQPTANCKKY